MNVLIIAFETGRWGPARLPKPLQESGFRVAALCPADNALAHTRYLDRHFPLRDVCSSRHVEVSLVRAMRAWKPRLIIPADERTVACLHALVRQTGAGGPGRLTPAEREIIVASLAPLDRLDATLLKSHTLELARQVGVLTPQGQSVATPEAAVGMAEAIGYPVYVKASFGWAGQGVTLCHDRAAVQAAMSALQPQHRPGLRGAIKRLMHRDWYPTDSAIDVQKAIAGTPAMFCAVALGGRMLAGFAGVAVQTSFATGPSSVVRISADVAMEAASAKMIAALGASGFIGFDFMVEASTGAVYLLECNPRPIQVCHLGARIGADLCAALARALNGEATAPVRADREATVALFPQEWLRMPGLLATHEADLDVPWEDADLLRKMVAA